ncbi:MAG: MaoC family dehydratase N-terminal domain-containing protein [Pseudomonadota bacterium]
MTERSLDQSYLEGWIGRQESAQDQLKAQQARLMETTLDRAASLSDGDALPPLWQWIYFPVEAPLSGLGRDGHPKLGGFLPPVALPRRMWAGGRLEIRAPLRLGETVERHSEIKSVALKQGKTGPLCFVSLLHRYLSGGEERISEYLDLVYREDPKPDQPAPPGKPAPTESDWQRRVTPSPIQLFRYSALTFNGHRIHYDRDYCRDVEGYPGLIFHGPLTATLLCGLAVEECAGRLTRFSYRAMAPLFDTAPFTLAGRAKEGGADLWAATPDGHLAMTADASFEA